MATADRLEYVLAGRDELTKPLRQAEGQMKRLGNQAQRTNKQMGAFSSNLANANKGTRAFAMGGLQQAGYQIGDFAVQVANGTSKMQAFGQQAPQFLQIFGPIGSVIGAVVAVVAAFGVAAEKSSGASASLSDKVDTLKSSIDNLKGVDEMLRESLEAPILAANTALTAYLTQLRETKLEEVIGSVRGAAQDVLSPYLKQMDKLNATSARTRENINKMIRAGDDPEAIKKLMQRVTLQEATADALERMAQTVALATVADSSEELAQNLLDARQALQDQGLLTDDLKAGFDQMLQAGGLLAVAYAKQKALTLEITDGVKQINDAEVYHDSIMRQQNITQSNLKTNYDLMVEAQKDRKKFLDDELVVMQQIVKASGSLVVTSSLRGGRSAGVGGPTADELIKNDPRVQLAYEIMRLNDLAHQKTLENAKKTAKAVKKTLSPEMKRMIDLGDAIGRSMENAMLSAVDGTMKAKDAFRVMASDIIKELYRVFFVKKVTGFISNAITFAAGPKTGNTGSLGLPNFDYNGGGYTGNGARAGGLDGRGGFMAMLHPRETIVDHTKGQSSGGVTVVQNINVSTGVQQTVRNEIQTLLPQIAEASKAAVLDARRRGGSFANAF